MPSDKTKKLLEGLGKITDSAPKQYPEEKVNSLKNDYSVYMIKNGRICVAAINSKNIEYVSDSIAAVIS